MGRFLTLLIAVSAVLAGAGMYYLQVYGFYRTLDATAPEASVVITQADGTTSPLPLTGFQGIDSDSSPLRLRICGQLTGALPEGSAPYPGAVPITAPGWFDCFDAAAIGAALERGEAQAYLSASHTPWGLDRVIAVFPDGRLFLWPQFNACGKELFDGKPLPDGCPPPPPRP